MKKKLLVILFFSTVSVFVQAQTEKFWAEHKGSDLVLSKSIQRETFPTDFKLFNLNVNSLKQVLLTAPQRTNANRSSVVISIPNNDGKLERFTMYEASNFEPELQAQFPEIRSYVGVGIDDKTAILRLSLDPRGIQTMVFRADKKTEFIEPYSQDGSVVAVYASGRNKGKLPFTCSTPEQVIMNDLSRNTNSTQASTGVLLNFRLALSCTAEYANYFGATSSAQSSLVLAAFNATMTRVNGVFEKDFAIRMNIIANTTSVIYYNATTDPYSDAAQMNNWNSQLQSTLTSVIGEANYDVGHLFGATGGGGNAGCIGCVCVNGSKGSGITSPADGVPAGDSFDIDYVAHELGHQFGANHTFSMSNEGTGVNMEPGSGVTIMGYAGITSQDIAAHSIDIFHAASIAQVQANMAGKTCPTSVAITHGTPVVTSAGNYTIPKSTPFMLTGSATDTGGTSSLTYCWEQYDNASAGQTGASSAASETKASGPNWRSYLPSSSPTRYFPNMTSVLAGQKTTSGDEILVEALSSVARTLNFRLTVRDNVAGQGQTNFATSTITVDATRGPLEVTSQNGASVTWIPGTTETITWNVNGTNTSFGGANVDILLSTDNGATFTTVLASNTPNDGSETITVPNILQPFCRIMVKASGSIFFNVNVKNIAIGYVVTTTTTCTDYTRTFSPAQAMATNWTGYLLPSTPITDSYTISDVDFKVVCTAARTNQVSFGLVKPGSSVVDVVAFDGPNSGCANNRANLNAIFDDEGVAFDCAATATGARYIPVGALSSLDGMNSAGQWRFAAKSTNTSNTISSVTLTLCKTETTVVLASEGFGLDNFVIYPNPNNGNFNIQFSSTSGNEVKVSVHDLRGRTVFNKSFNNNGLFNESLQLNNVQAGIYLVTVQDGDRKEVKKIVVE